MLGRLFKKSDVTNDPLMPKGHKMQIKNLIITTLALNILSLALPIMTLQVYDRVLPNPGSGTLVVLIAGVCLAIILEGALRLTRAYMLGWSGAAYEHRLSCSAIRYIMNADLSRVQARGLGHNLQNMSSIGKLKDFYNGQAMIVIFELAFVALFMWLTIYIAGPLAVVPATILMIFTVISLSQGQKLRHVLEARDVKDDARYNFLIEGLDGIHTVKSFALESRFLRRYESFEQDCTITNYDVSQTASSTQNVSALFSHIMVAAVISVGAVLVIKGMITTGALIAAVLLSGRMMQPIQRALSLWGKYQDYTLARSKVEPLFDLPQHVSMIANDIHSQKAGSLDISDVSFRHKDSDPWLLKDVNFSLDPGECVLLSGAHGSGKTTFLEMIAGIYMPSRGEIQVDSHNVQRYAAHRFVHHVGYLQSDPVAFRGTIRDNLTCFNQIDELQARKIAALLNVDQEIARLPSGFDTPLMGDRSDIITPGLKQRIAMVRVLGPHPRLLLIDNVDAGMDQIGYQHAYQLFSQLKGKATMVIISDDHNMRALADRHFVLENGKISEEKTPYRPSRVTPYQRLKI